MAGEPEKETQSRHERNAAQACGGPAVALLTKGELPVIRTDERSDGDAHDAPPDHPAHPRCSREQYTTAGEESLPLAEHA